MSTKELKIDKSTWGEGPWQDEPDKVEWRTHGFPCLIVRGSSGQLCGYVAVTAGHPWYGKDCNDVDASVHGGLTFDGTCQPNGHICHVPKPGESDDVWWLGFDCANGDDYAPRFAAHLRQVMWRYHERPDTDAYRNLAYVTAEVESLAAQAKAVQP
jgi:hypothetical protein